MIYVLLAEHLHTNTRTIPAEADLKHLIRWQNRLLMLPVLLMATAIRAAADNLTTDMPTQLEEAFPTMMGMTDLLLAGTILLHHILQWQHILSSTNMGNVGIPY